MRWGVIASITLLLLIGALISLSHGLGAREPSYGHKTLTEWFGNATQGQSGLYEALRATGTNAYPVLIRMLRKEDLPGVSALASLLSGQSLIPVHYVPAEVRHSQAVYGIGALGEHAKELLPEVVRAYQMRRSPSSQCAAAQIIAGIGPDAKAALPTLLKGLNGTNELVLSDTLYAILRVNMAAPEPALVVPALTNFLYNPSTAVRIRAADALGFFGPAAKSALPHLLPLANDPDFNLARYARQALERIEPGMTLDGEPTPR